jgi:osmotically-inducible protein OsmY
LARAARCHKIGAALRGTSARASGGHQLPVFARPKALLAAGAALISVASLTSCIVPILAGGAATGGYVAGQERGVGTQLSDTTIRAEINDRWNRYDSDMQHQLSLSVYDGRVLITGTVSNPEFKTQSVRLAWEVKGVKEVNSEIELAASTGIGDAARDELITTRLRSAILFDGDIRSVNYTIDTVNGAVFLSGSARTQAELDKVTNYARNIPNVKRVVSYVRIRPGEPAAPANAVPANAAPPAAGAAQDWPPASQTNPGPSNAAPTNLAPANAAPGATVTNPGAPAKIEVQPLQ